jgi:hypothetical protein
MWARKSRRSDVKLRAATDRGGHASRFFGLAPVREEQLGFTGGTSPAIIYVFRQKARSQQLAAIGFGQVEHLLSFDRLPFRKHGSKVVGDFFPDLVAAGANARSNSGVEICRDGTEDVLQAVNSAPGYPACGSSPTRVDSSYSAVNGVNQQDRHTVGSSDAYAALWLVGDERITFVAAITQFTGIQNRRRVDLP